MQYLDIIYEEILLYHYEDFSEAYETKKKNKYRNDEDEELDSDEWVE